MFVQAHRPMKLTTPLGPDTFILTGFNGHEGISQLFQFHLDLATQEDSIAFDRLLGQKVTVEWALRDGEKRYFNGLVNRISQGERAELFTRFGMEVVPTLWVLSRQVRSRIFQHISVPDILKKVFAGLDVSYEIMGTFDERDYCAQYRESDFQFASRLMEEEGIYYFFKHGNGSHTMVVANTPQSHPDAEGGPVPYEEVIGGTRDEDRIWAWAKTQELRSGKATLWDHCFELPGKHLEAQKTTLDSVQIGANTHKLKVGGNDNFELYDYPGHYAQRYDGIDKGGGEKASDVQKIFEDNKRTVEIRMQAETTPALVAEGTGNCEHFVSGCKFSLVRHFSDNGKYVLTSIEHRCSQPLASDSGNPFEYESRFTAIPLAVPYRPPRITPVPAVAGTHTAIVVGPSGEEIFTDKYGRVKVQFHWDREGKNDADSSCWVRVGTHWAGKQWGAIHIPRIGQEVIVDFLEGHPDQPIIVGSVYNGEQMPPYKLPDNKTQSGIKSRSSKGGSGENFNEIRFEDKKGSEQVYIHAERNMDTLVEKDRTIHVQATDTETVDKDQTINLHANQTETVDKNRTTAIRQNDTLTVDKDQSNTIGGSRTETVAKDESITIGGAVTVSIVKDRTENILGAVTETVAKSLTLTVGPQGITITTAGALTVTAAQGVTVVSGAPLSVVAPMISLATAMLQVTGVVQCTSVVSPTYTPGVGNMI